MHTNREIKVPHIGLEYHLPELLGQNGTKGGLGYVCIRMSKAGRLGIGAAHPKRPPEGLQSIALLSHSKNTARPMHRVEVGRTAGSTLVTIWVGGGLKATSTPQARGTPQ